MASRGSTARREQSQAQDRNIPLRCSLCPDKGQFSDISHLLTHISSKGHLACRFKTEMAAKSGDMTARGKITDYDTWYDLHGIDALLGERILSKERRKIKPRARGPSGANSARNSRPPPPARQPVPIKNEPIEFEDDIPWGHEAYRLRPSDPDRQSHSIYQTPPTRRTRPFFHMHDYDTKFEAKFDNRLERELSSVPSYDGTPSLGLGEEASESTSSSKLKGIKYPGMDVFDAATPEQRRKRNQRKEPSVVNNMKNSSESIEPLEVVWQGLGNFERHRDIYASPSIDGSPVSRKAELLANRKRRKQPRQDADSGVTGKARGRAIAGSRKPANQKGSSRPADDSDFDDESWDNGSCDVFQDDNSHAINRTASPLQRDRHQYPRRQALQALDSNQMLAPSTQGMKNSNFSFPFVGHDAHLRGSMSHGDFGIGYMVPGQGGDGNSFNPLCMQSRSSSYYHTPAFDNDRAPPPPFPSMSASMSSRPFGFHAINSQPSNSNQISLQHHTDHGEY